jgi:hypothetical protein
MEEFIEIKANIGRILKYHHNWPPTLQFEANITSRTQREHSSHRVGQVTENKSFQQGHFQDKIIDKESILWVSIILFMYNNSWSKSLSKIFKVSKNKKPERSCKKKYIEKNWGS